VFLDSGELDTILGAVRQALVGNDVLQSNTGDAFDHLGFIDEGSDREISYSQAVPIVM
jgi:hypothetical protein